MFGELGAYPPQTDQPYRVDDTFVVADVAFEGSADRADIDVDHQQQQFDLVIVQNEVHRLLRSR